MVNYFMPGVISITVHSEINCFILRISSDLKFRFPNNSSWVINDRNRFFPLTEESKYLLHWEDKVQCWYQVEYYSHSLRHSFCISKGSCCNEMDPQYFFKSRLLILTGLFFKTWRIFSPDVPFSIVVIIFCVFLDSQIYWKYDWLANKAVWWRSGHNCIKMRITWNNTN